MPAHAGEISFRAERDSVEIGDTFLFTVNVVGAETTVFEIPQEPNLAPFEIWDVRGESTARRLDLVFTLQAFETGLLQIPPLSIGCVTKDSRVVVTTESKTVEILDVLSGADTDLRPIIGSLGEKTAPEISRWYYWLIAAVLVFAIIAYLIYRRIRRRAPSVDVEDETLDPYDLFLRRVSRIEGMIDSGDTRFKEIYSLITEAMKMLIKSQDGVDTIGLTTTETLGHDGIKAWTKSDYDEFAAILKKADLIKFAKAPTFAYEAKQDLFAIRDLGVRKYAPKPMKEV